MVSVSLIGLVARGRVLLLAPLRSRLLRFFGDISYWLYLIHFLVLYQFVDRLSRYAPGFVARSGWPLWLTVTTVVLSISILSGVLVRRYIDLPVLRMKSRF